MPFPQPAPRCSAAPEFLTCFLASSKLWCSQQTVPHTSSRVPADPSLLCWLQPAAARPQTSQPTEPLPPAVTPKPSRVRNRFNNTISASRLAQHAIGAPQACSNHILSVV